MSSRYLRPATWASRCAPLGGSPRAIGLSDITLEKVQEIVAIARIKQAVVQVESHPYLPEWELLSFCQEHGIVLLAFAPLGHASTPNVLEDPVITAIAARLNMTPAQVALSWSATTGATSYKIYRGATSGGETLLKSGVRITLGLLGLGADGHTASLFPGMPVLDERRHWVGTMHDPEAGTRLTLTHRT